MEVLFRNVPRRLSAEPEVPVFVVPLALGVELPCNTTAVGVDSSQLGLGAAEVLSPEVLSAAACRPRPARPRSSGDRPGNGAAEATGVGAGGWGWPTAGAGAGAMELVELLREEPREEAEEGSSDSAATGRGLLVAALGRLGGAAAPWAEGREAPRPAKCAVSC